QRVAAARLLGQEGEARDLLAEAAKVPAGSPREAYLAAFEHAALGRLGDARPLADKATQGDPQHAPGWFLLGICCDGRKDSTKAVSAYGICNHLRPDWPLPFFYRGRTNLKAGNWQEAVADFDKVLKRQPDLVAAYVDRAAARRELLKFPDAIADLTEALK